MKGKNEFKTKIISKVKVRVMSVKNWKTKDIIRCLKQIEDQDGFRGFMTINFEFQELPEITYLMDIKE